MVQLDPSPCLRSKTPSSASRFPPHSRVSRGSWLLHLLLATTPLSWVTPAVSPASLPPASPDEQMQMCPHQAPEQTFQGLMVAPEIKSSAGPWVWGAWPAFQLLPSSPSFPRRLQLALPEEAVFCLASRISHTPPPAGNLDQARCSSPVGRLPEPSPVRSSSHSWSH